ncbi:MAG: acyl--CoA ligase [Candidatus Tectomicrobia bacterium]|nr:acyl--CoA ligase [Candidatus Tectomicrobia bacterium]
MDNKTDVASLVNLGDLVNREVPPEAVAVIDCLHEDTPRIYSHGAIDAAANAVARGLIARGYQRGDRIAIIAANRVDYLTAYFGTMRAGMISVPVNFKLPRDTVDYVLRDAGVSMVVADAERRSQCPADLPVVEFASAAADGFDAFLDPGVFDVVHPEADEIAMILYTSGSTGRPKGVPLTHAGQLWAIGVRARAPIDWPQHRFLVAAPLFHMNALAASKFTLAVHASMVLLPQFRAPAFIRAIGQHRCTWLTAVPTMMALMAQEQEALKQTDLSSVTRVAMGSAPLTQALMDQVQAIFPGAQLSNGYGTTETGPVGFGPHPEGIPTPALALGYPIPGIRLRLVQDEQFDADEGVLQMWTPALMPGYHQLPQKTAEAMTRDGYYITGDIMRRDQQGFYYFVGRADDMFVCSGENIYPGEVEKMLERHPAIHQACIVPVPDPIRGQKPVAFIVQAPGQRLKEQDVKEFALANAPAYQHPRHVEFVEELPLAGTNKINRQALIDRAVSIAG